MTISSVWSGSRSKAFCNSARGCAVLNLAMTRGSATMIRSRSKTHRLVTRRVIVRCPCPSLFTAQPLGRWVGCSGDSSSRLSIRRAQGSRLHFHDLHSGGGRSSVQVTFHLLYMLWEMASITKTNVTIITECARAGSEGCTTPEPWFCDESGKID